MKTIFFLEEAGGSTAVVHVCQSRAGVTSVRSGAGIPLCRFLAGCSGWSQVLAGGEKRHREWCGIEFSCLPGQAYDSVPTPF
jgi:hypothetical protein